MLVGAGLLLTSLFVGWYGVTFSTASPGQGSSATYAVTFLPGPDALSNCWDGVNCLAPGNGSATYASVHLADVGNLYVEVQYLVLVAGLLGLAAAFLMWRAFAARRSPWIGAVLAAAAALAGALAPYLAWSQGPGAVGGTIGDLQPGPWRSFAGSYSEGMTSWNWGPQIGWYLAGAGALILVAGLVLWVLTRGRERTRARAPPPGPPTPVA